MSPPSTRRALPCAPGIRALQPISGTAVSNIVKDRAAAAGLSAEQITAHSLRAGHATSAARAGVSVERDRRPLQTTSSRDLGL